MIMNASDKIILAVDELDLEQALLLAAALGQRVHAFKIHNLYDLHGPFAVRRLLEAGAQRVWVDAKLHDIPNTVRRRAEAIAESGADIISVHASGGTKMMEAALRSGLRVLAITILTSLSAEDVANLYRRDPAQAALYLAYMAARAGAHGVVCSPKEVGILTGTPELQHKLKFVVPGIRSAGVPADDQQRVDTPTAALKDGADYLVIGRQITTALDPAAALRDLEREITEALTAEERGQS